MTRRKQLDENRLKRMRDAFWDVDSSPGPVPDTHEARMAYEIDGIRYQVLYAVQDRMERDGLTQHDIAMKMGVSEGRISQILAGDQNLTIKTLAALAVSVGAHFSIRLTDDRAVPSDMEHARALHAEREQRRRV